MNARAPLDNTPAPKTQVRPSTGTGPWHDPKRHLWALSPALPVLGIAALALYRKAPKKMRALTWFGPLMVHGIIPVLDQAFGEDASNPPTDAIAALEADPHYARMVKAFIPLQYAANLLGAWLYSRPDTPLLDRIGLTLTVGTLNGIGINTAHELSHKHSRSDQMLSLAALAPTGYGHFRVEHPYGHHKRVATPEDPASSQMGESFWEFLPRTVLGSFKSAIDIETRRLARKGKPFWCVENELLQGWAMSGALGGVLLALFGKKILPFFAVQAVYGFSLLEVINYVEHYGLKREKLPNGQYERTRPEHSWNSNNIVTNLVLYQLQRHSDHHAFPTRSFQALRHFEAAPQLPGGYASLLLPAYFPRWWFGLMDQRVMDHYDGDLSRANVFPKARARLLKKFGRADQPMPTATNSVPA